MIGLGVGVDYSLFILSRANGSSRRDDLEEAMGPPVATAGAAVLSPAARSHRAALAAGPDPDHPAMGSTRRSRWSSWCSPRPPCCRRLGLLGPHDSLPAAVRDGSEEPVPPSKWTSTARRPRWPARRHPDVGARRSSRASCSSSPPPPGTCRRAGPAEGPSRPRSTQRQAYDLLSFGFGPGSNGD